jgi:hypothetical protein
MGMSSLMCRSIPDNSGSDIRTARREKDLESRPPNTQTSSSPTTNLKPHRQLEIMAYEPAAKYAPGALRGHQFERGWIVGEKDGGTRI